MVHTSSWVVLLAAKFSVLAVAATLGLDATEAFQGNCDEPTTHSPPASYFFVRPLWEFFTPHLIMQSTKYLA